MHENPSTSATAKITRRFLRPHSHVRTSDPHRFRTGGPICLIAALVMSVFVGCDSRVSSTSTEDAVTDEEERIYTVRGVEMSFIRVATEHGEFLLSKHEMSLREYPALMSTEAYEPFAQKMADEFVLSYTGHHRSNPLVGEAAVRDEEVRKATEMAIAYYSNGDNPVIGLRADEMSALCAALSTHVDGVAYIPTPEEWLHAMRAGRATQYWWGDRAEDYPGEFTDKSSRRNWEFLDGIGSSREGVENPAGFVNLIGNVAEVVRFEKGQIPLDLPVQQRIGHLPDDQRLYGSIGGFLVGSAGEVRRSMELSRIYTNCSEHGFKRMSPAGIRLMIRAERH